MFSYVFFSCFIMFIFLFAVYCNQPPLVQHANHNGPPDAVQFELETVLQYSCYPGTVSNKVSVRAGNCTAVYCTVAATQVQYPLYCNEDMKSPHMYMFNMCVVWQKIRIRYFIRNAPKELTLYIIYLI